MPEISPVTSVTIDTSVLPEKEQFAFWCDGLFDVTGIGTERRGCPEAPFHFKLTHHQSSGILLHKYECGTPCILHRTSLDTERGDLDFIGIHFRAPDSSERIIQCPHMRSIDLAQPFVVSSREVSGYALYLNRSLLLEQMPAVDQLHGYLMGESALARAFRATVQEMFSQLEQACPWQASSMISAIGALAMDVINLQDVGDMESGQIGQMSILRSVINHIGRNYHRRDCTPETIARAVGVSRTKLYRICRPYDSPMELVWQTRLRKAAEALRTGSETNIARLACSVGFSGRQAFTKAFTAQYEISPRDYRRAMRSAATASSAKGDHVESAWEKLRASLRAAQVV